MSVYEPKVGDLVRVLECSLNQICHLGLLGTVRCVRGSHTDVDLLGDRGSCTASRVQPAPDADYAAVYGKAECDCAGKDPQHAAALVVAENQDRELIALDAITDRLLDLLALVHGQRRAAQERVRKSIERGAES